MLIIEEELENIILFAHIEKQMQMEE